MTPSTSEVAVCRSRDSRSSERSRAFSMAMTAWAAKFSTNSICLSVKGRTSLRQMMNAPTTSPSFEHRHTEAGAAASELNPGRRRLAGA